MLTKRTVLAAAMALLAIVVFFAWTAWNDGHFGWAHIIGLAATVLLLAVIWIWPRANNQHNPHLEIARRLFREEVKLDEA